MIKVYLLALLLHGQLFMIQNTVHVGLGTQTQQNNLKVMNGLIITIYFN